jgi:LytS/YehU family sensor histidine kinase
VESLRDGAYIHASIKTDIQNEKLVFEISNNFEEKELESEKGIGLENLRQRLELLYPDKHQLDIVKGDNEFKITLQLNML